MTPIKQFKQQLDSISPSFCVAKWKQVTLHLQTGHNHSCHHPTVHKIPLSEIAANPAALHNTNYKKQQRKQMLEGVRPAECEYCWKVEDSHEDAISDRVWKSHDVWAQPHMQEVAAMPWDADVSPSYLEVSFSSVCNFKCSYCTPQVSSAWMEEIKQFGSYPTHDKFNDITWYESAGQMPIPHNQHNPYVDAFWEWWPSIYKELKHFRVTGGEPLLSKDTFRVLDYIIENPNPNLDLSINSNMCVPEALLSKFIEKIKIICNEKKVRRFKIFTSADAHGAAAEYIRDGLDYELWKSNIQRVLDHVPECTFTIMSTYNLLSVASYMKFLNDVVEIKNKYGGPNGRPNPLILDTPYLRYPSHQAIFLLPNNTAEFIQEQVDFMQQHMEDRNDPLKINTGFAEWEVEKFKRILELMKSKEEMGGRVLQAHKDFVAFVDEHDRRRGTDFKKTFPEYVSLYEYWKTTSITG
jgi:organic radical activating enzyme